MGFPSLLAIVGAWVAILLGISITFVASRLLKLQASTISIGDAHRQTRFAILLIIAELATIVTYRYFVTTANATTSGIAFDATDVLNELLRSGVVILLPLIIVARSTRQTFDSIGIRKENLRKTIIVGILPSAAFLILLILVAPAADATFASLTAASLGSGFIVFLLTGFSEEIVWRGYIQTRIIARTGKVYGLLAASLVFSLWHLPINYRLYGGVLEALGTSLLVQFPLGLMFGYMMLRTQSIIPSSIYHMFYDWSPNFFQIPS